MRSGIDDYLRMIRNVALIVLFNEDDKILLQHRTDDAHAFPGHWGFFGGGVQNGETPEEAIKRETFEELNYILKSPTLILTYDYKTDTHVGKKYYFSEKFTDKSSLKLQEGQDMRWVTFAQSKGLKINDWNRRILKQIEL